MGSNEWNADAYRALSATYSISAALQKQAIAFGVVFLVWKLDSNLKSMIEAGKDQAKPQSTPPTVERVTEAVATLRQLHGALHEVCDKLSDAASGNFLCRFLAGSKIESVRERAECLLDLAEAAELTINPNLDSLYFDEAIGELKRGQTHGLASIR
jgi:hypothetical protein